jgi:hypothetical protein
VIFGFTIIFIYELSADQFVSLMELTETLWVDCFNLLPQTNYSLFHAGSYDHFTEQTVLGNVGDFRQNIHLTAR